MKNIFTAASGLNNRLDPVRLGYDPKTGIAELAVAVNVYLDESGRISRRPGNTKLLTGEFHSLFCDGGDCFVIKEWTSEATLEQVGTDYALTGVRSGLTKGQKCSMAQVGAQTFYSNGVENGVIEDGISTAWPVHSHVGADTTRSFSAAPVGTHIAWFAGRMLIAEDNVLWISEPFAYGKFNQAKGFVLFGSTIRIVKPVQTGVFVSDANKTWFLEGTDPAQWVQKKVTDFPGHEWSDAIGHLESGELRGSAVWSSDHGLIVGLLDGTILNVTEEKLIYPAGSVGASLIDKEIIINSIE